MQCLTYRPIELVSITTQHTNTSSCKSETSGAGFKSVKSESCIRKDTSYHLVMIPVRLKAKEITLHHLLTLFISTKSWNILFKVTSSTPLSVVSATLKIWIGSSATLHRDVVSSSLRFAEFVLLFREAWGTSKNSGEFGGLKFWKQRMTALKLLEGKSRHK